MRKLIMMMLILGVAHATDIMIGSKYICVSTVATKVYDVKLYAPDNDHLYVGTVYLKFDEVTTRYTGYSESNDFLRVGLFGKGDISIRINNMKAIDFKCEVAK